MEVLKYIANLQQNYISLDKNLIYFNKSIKDSLNHYLDLQVERTLTDERFKKENSYVEDVLKTQNNNAKLEIEEYTNKIIEEEQNKAVSLMKDILNNVNKYTIEDISSMFNSALNNSLLNGASDRIDEIINKNIQEGFDKISSNKPEVLPSEIKDKYKKDFMYSLDRNIDSDKSGFISKSDSAIKLFYQNAYSTLKMVKDGADLSLINTQESIILGDDKFSMYLNENSFVENKEDKYKIKKSDLGLGNIDLDTFIKFINIYGNYEYKIVGDEVVFNEANGPFLQVSTSSDDEKKYIVLNKSTNTSTNKEESIAVQINHNSNTIGVMKNNDFLAYDFSQNVIELEIEGVKYKTIFDNGVMHIGKYTNLNDETKELTPQELEELKRKLSDKNIDVSKIIDFAKVKSTQTDVEQKEQIEEPEQRT